VPDNDQQETPSVEVDRDMLRVITAPPGEADRVDPNLPEPVLRSMFETMLKIRIVDERMFNLQRQGRISFYGAAKGQEAVAVGSAAALEPSDPIFPGLRESGAMLYRGWSIEKYVCQCIGNSGDILQGRQMPCHYSDKDVEYVSWSSCIGTQVPQAVGAAYALRLRGVRSVVATFFGDGATSEGDFHAGMTFAARWKAPVLFLCQNNQWSISVPVSGQTAASSIAAKAAAYGIPGRRVDGNDILAVYGAVREAAESARHGGGPRFIEFLTYRMGAHSTSDDPSIYRDEAVTEKWGEKDPILLFRQWLTEKGTWSESWEEEFRAEFSEKLAEHVRNAESRPEPEPGTLFEHLYATLPVELEAQKAELLRHLSEEEKGQDK